MNTIDKQTYKISEDNYYKLKQEKRQIVIGNSLRKNYYHITHLQHKEMGKTKEWNTFTISREGVIYQHYKPCYYTDYLNIKKADKQSISIVLENMGGLYKIKSGDYINWLNEQCDEGYVVRKNFFGQKFWEEYRDLQLNSLVNLCGYLCNQFNIRKKVMDMHFYNKNAQSFEGVLIRGNYFEDDPNTNPTLDLQKLNELISKND